MSMVAKHRIYIFTKFRPKILLIEVMKANNSVLEQANELIPPFYKYSRYRDDDYDDDKSYNDEGFDDDNYEEEEFDDEAFDDGEFDDDDFDDDYEK